MRRSELLIESLMQRQMTRQGPIYLYKKPVGPPATSDEKLSKFLWDTAQRFDLSPIIHGDQQQARWVAQDFVAFLKKRAAQERIPFEEVRKRMKTIGPHMRRSVATFYTYLDAKVRS